MMRFSFLRLSVLLASALLPAAALAQLGGAERVEFPVRTATGTTEKIFGFLFLPNDAAPGAKVPAMVVVHGSGGVTDRREGDWGRALSASGIAVLAIDSFTPRGVRSTVDDQSRVTGLQMLRDAYGGLAFLAARDTIDAERVGVMGMSKGGTVALDAADERTQRSGHFAAYVPFYPGCSTQFRNPRMKGPILMLIGANDDYTGVKTCAEYVERIRAAGASVELKVYPGAHHGFDGDTSNFRESWVPQAQNYRDCVIYVEDDLRLVTKAGTPVDFRQQPREAMAILKKECLRTGATVGGNAGVKQKAHEDVKAFLKAHLVR
jgi:dienelactone hydrolase